MKWKDSKYSTFYVIYGVVNDTASFFFLNWILCHLSEGKYKILWNTLRLTQQRECDSKDEDHDTTTQRQHKVTGDHDPHDKQSGVLPFEILDGGLVLSCPHWTHEDQSHHSSTQKHAKRVQEPEYWNMKMTHYTWHWFFKIAQPAGGNNKNRCKPFKGRCLQCKKAYAHDFHYIILYSKKSSLTYSMQSHDQLAAVICDHSSSRSNVVSLINTQNNK